MPSIQEVVAAVQEKVSVRYANTYYSLAEIGGVFKEQEIADVAADLITKASSHVKVCLYKFEADSDFARKVIDALTQLQQRATETQTPITVQFVINRRAGLATIYKKSPEETQRDFSALIEKLNNSYFQLQLAFHTAKAFGSYHSKMILVDNDKMLLLSGDPMQANSAKQHQYETGILLNSESLCHEVNAEFDNIWQKYGPTITAHPTSSPLETPSAPASNSSLSTYSITSSEIESSEDLTSLNPTLYLSSRAHGGIRKDYSPLKVALLAAIEKAENNICIITSNLNDNEIIQALANAVNRGVTLHIMTTKFGNQSAERLWGGTNLDKMNQLALLIKPEARKNFCLRWAINAETLEIVRDKEPYGIHAKFCCIDQNILAMGSSPLDKQGMNNSHETDVVVSLTQQQGMEILDHVFWSRYALGRDYYIDSIIDALSAEAERFKSISGQVAQDKYSQLSSVVQHLKTSLSREQALSYLNLPELHTSLQKARLFSKKTTTSMQTLLNCIELCDSAKGEKPIGALQDYRGPSEATI